MTFLEKNGLRYFQFEIFQKQPIFHAVFTRHGGVSQAPFESLNTGGTVGDDPVAVLENHRRIYEATGFDYFSRFDVWQVHGDKILCADAPRDPDSPHQKADGILTQNSGLTLFMRFADCVPILLFDPVKRVIGIVHAGWQGTAKLIGMKAIGKMTECFGSKPEDIFAGIGPSICQRCYPVGAEVYDAFMDAYGEAGEQYFMDIQGSRHLNLWAANRNTLRSAGVNQIEVSGLCTACQLGDWYSHRAEDGRTGRFAVMMALTDG